MVTHFRETFSFRIKCFVIVAVLALFRFLLLFYWSQLGVVLLRLRKSYFIFLDIFPNKYVGYEQMWKEWCDIFHQVMYLAQYCQKHFVLKVIQQMWNVWELERNGNVHFIMPETRMWWDLSLHETACSGKMLAIKV